MNDVFSLERLKFSDPKVTADGAPRAHVSLRVLETLWINTGTLCNIECVNCYIESSPTNDRLVYITHDEVAVYLDEIASEKLATQEIGLTGGEPFMNPDCCAIIEEALHRGFTVLVLTNAMQPMQRPRVMAALLDLKKQFGSKLTLRVSLDHYTQSLHDKERGAGAWVKTLEGIAWLVENGFDLSIAGRTCWGEDEAQARAGYAAAFLAAAITVEAKDASRLILFPEMDESADVPEITTACWDILDVKPDDLMCANARMVVKRKGAGAPSVVACTLLAYDLQFELGQSLAQAAGDVALNHPHCAKFCVLGGGSCSAV